MNNKYILDGHRAVLCGDLIKWATWFGKANRTVAKKKMGDVRVSTVFLGLDHSFSDKGAPLLFETMIFGGEHDEYQKRCSTWGQAEKMHERACEKAFSGRAKG